MGKIKTIISYLVSIDAKLDVVLDTLPKPSMKVANANDRPTEDELARISGSSKMLMYETVGKIIDDILTLKEIDPISTDEMDMLIKSFFESNGFHKVENDLMALLIRFGFVQDDIDDRPVTGELELAVIQMVQDTVDSKGISADYETVKEIAGIVVNSNSAWSELDAFIDSTIDEKLTK